eukprot:1758706-Rhodomonas_salina.1
MPKQHQCQTRESNASLKASVGEAGTWGTDAVGVLADRSAEDHVTTEGSAAKRVDASDNTTGVAPDSGGCETDSSAG